MASGNHERTTALLRRPWTPAERRVVLNGLFGRSLIAIEPVFCSIVFGSLTIALMFLPLPATSTLTRWESAIIIAPIFGLVTIAFVLYATFVLLTPVRALLQTFSPIFIVDGYVRYRRPDHHTEVDSNGYIAVLNEDRFAVAEWPSVGDTPMPDSLRPALVEFSFYGGIHRIDGRSTGVLPESMPLAGVGDNRPRV
jgi:hypothetical protein